MTKIQKNALIFSILFLQFLISVVVGLFALNLYNSDKIAPLTFIGSIGVGSLNRAEALKKTVDFFTPVIKDGFLTLQYGDDESYKIKYSDINAVYDGTATVTTAYGTGGGGRTFGLLRGYFTSNRVTVHPVLRFDEAKLKEKLGELAAKLKVAPVNANIYLRGDTVEKIPHEIGKELNIENTVQKIKNEAALNPEIPLTFAEVNNFEIKTLIPGITSQDLEGADEIISRYSTDIKSLENEESVRLASLAVNKVLILPADIRTGEDAGVFSFNKYLSAENGLMEQNNEGYNQVASTLYAAVLNAGIPEDAITRTPNDSSVGYIEAGKDAVVLGTGIDFKFQNVLNSPMVIFSEVKNNKLIITLVGSKG